MGMEMRTKQLPLLLLMEPFRNFLRNQEVAQGVSVFPKGRWPGPLLGRLS